MLLNAGARLGPYEIVAPLGAGGMGEVYQARDTRLDRTVAIKILPAAVADDPQRRERFRREARAISSVTHPHICTLLDVGAQDGIEFLVMEYLAGETLAHRLLRGTLPLDEVLVLRYADRQLIAITIESNADGFRTSVPQPLFSYTGFGEDYTYDVGPDGRRFLVNAVVSETSQPIVVVLNWPAALKQ